MYTPIFLFQRKVKGSILKPGLLLFMGSSFYCTYFLTPMPFSLLFQSQRLWVSLVWSIEVATYYIEVEMVCSRVGSSSIEVKMGFVFVYRSCRQFLAIQLSSCGNLGKPSFKIVDAWKIPIVGCGSLVTSCENLSKPIKVGGGRKNPMSSGCGSLIKPTLKVEGAYNNPMYYSLFRARLDANNFQEPSLASLFFLLGSGFVDDDLMILLYVKGAWENPSCWLRVVDKPLFFILEIYQFFQIHQYCQHDLYCSIFVILLASIQCWLLGVFDLFFCSVPLLVLDPCGF